MAVEGFEDGFLFLTKRQFDKAVEAFDQAHLEEYRRKYHMDMSKEGEIDAKHMAKFFLAWKRLPDDLKIWVKEDLQSIAFRHGADLDSMKMDPMAFDLTNIEKIDKNPMALRVGSPPKYIGHKAVVEILRQYWIEDGREAIVGRPESNSRNLNNYQTTPLVRYIAKYLMMIDREFIPEVHSSGKKRNQDARIRGYELRAYSALDDLRGPAERRPAKRGG